MPPPPPPSPAVSNTAVHLGRPPLGCRRSVSYLKPLMEDLAENMFSQMGVQGHRSYRTREEGREWVLRCRACVSGLACLRRARPAPVLQGLYQNRRAKRHGAERRAGWRAGVVSARAGARAAGWKGSGIRTSYRCIRRSPDGSTADRWRAALAVGSFQVKENGGNIRLLLLLLLLLR